MGSSMKRGALIVIEGCDRSGKSTQCKNLLQSLQKQNIPAFLMNFPDRKTHTGKVISEYLSNKETKLCDQAIHLLFSANRWENVDKLKSFLFNGVTLIVDRYSYSGIAFSAAKKVPGMDINWCKQPENGLPKPDLIFLLTLTAKEATKRAGYGDERYENESMQKQVAEKFSELCDTSDNWKIVDASGSIEEVHAEMLNSIMEKIREVETQPLDYLNFSQK